MSEQQEAPGTPGNLRSLVKLLNASNRTAAEAENLREYSYIDGKEIIGTVRELQKSMNDLKDEFQKLATKCLGLSRVTGLLLAIRNVMDILPSVSTAFYQNAIHLIPESLEPIPNSKGSQEKNERLSSILKTLAVSFHELRTRINEFKALADEDLPLKEILLTSEMNLRYRASCAYAYESEYSGVVFNSVTWLNIPLAQMNLPSIRYYVHQFIPELQYDLKEMADQVRVFSGDGIAAIHHEQQRSSGNFKVVLSVSTFFSSVTGGALQMAESTTPVSGRENLFHITLVLWFASMIFSVGAALNSLLAMAWRGTSLGTRGDQLPSWPKKWTEELQLAFLGISITTFSVGLVTFTYSSSDSSSPAPSITLSFFVAIFTGVALVLAWMIADTQLRRRRRLRNTSQKDQPSLNPQQRGAFEDVKTPSSPVAIKLRDTIKTVRQITSVVNAFALTKPETIPSIDLEEYGIINDVAYSDDGSWLAVACTKDHGSSSNVMRSTVIYKSQLNYNEFHQSIGHPDAVGRGHLYWSPSGNRLIIKFDHHLEIWNLETSRRHELRNYVSIQDVTWSDDDTFLVAFIKERNSIVQRMRVSNKQISSMDPSFVFRDVEIRSISVESTSGFLIIINEVVQSPEGFKPKSARSEKRIIVYDVQGPKARYEIPTLNNIESVHAIKGSSTILFIIRSQAQNDLTFQLCSLDVGSEGGRRPTLRKGRTITSQSSTEERIGPTRLGGNSNQFIFCGLSSGAIAIWHALKPNISYGYFAPEVLLDKRLSSLSWKRGNDGSHCLAVAVRSSSVLRIWRGRKVVWGVADACGKLESAYKKTTRESLYLPFRPASTGVPRELEAAYRKITAESLYIPASLRVASREDNLSKLQSACEVILRDSPYFFSPSITMNSADVPESLHHAYERIANKSPYIIPPNTADFGLTVSKELVDAYQDIARDSIYFYPPSSRNFTPDVPEELEDYYERTLGQSPYISLPSRPNVP